MDFDVLILGTDANAYYMARCCYEAYKIKPYVIGASVLAFTKNSSILNVSYNKEMWNESVFLNMLEDFANKHKDKILLISTNETYSEMISKNRDKLSKKYYYNIADFEIIKTLTNKKVFYETYKDSPLIFPKTKYLNIKKDKLKDNDLEFPLVIKAANVVKWNHISFEGKNKIYKINTKEELDKILGLIKNSAYDDELIIQEFIPGGDDNLFDSVVYVNTKGDVEFITFAQIGLQERTKSMVGNAAVLINGFNTTNGNVEKQVEAIKKFFSTVKYKGFAELDMKYDIRTNEFKVLEINARQGRCSYYVSVLGKNLVKTLVEDCILNKHNKYEFLNKEVLLSFVPYGITKKYINNDKYKEEVKKLWHKVIKPMSYSKDHNIKRFLMLRKRWLNYYKEYKDAYWR